MRVQAHGRGTAAIASTFVAAFLLSLLPGPDWAERFRPDWVALVLIYWCIATPGRVGVGVGWLAGLMLDVLYGSVFGQHALALAFLAYLAHRLHLQIRVFPLWQQAVTVLVMLLINQMLVLWIKGVLGQAPTLWPGLTSSIVGMVIWPLLFIILRDVRRRADLS